jgi:PPOX class probable F420-dependent enzyme
MRLRKALVDFLARERLCRVATVDKNGRPHVVSVCHVLVDGKIYFATETGSKKAWNLKANPRATILVDLYSEDWSILRGVMVQGTSRLIRGGSPFRRIQKLLYQKYPQYPDQAALDESSDTIVEVTPAHVSSWGFGR